MVAALIVIKLTYTPIKNWRKSEKATQKNDRQIGRHSTGHGIRPDLSVPKHPFARSPVGPSQNQLYDVKTIGRLPIYHRSYRAQPTDQRARAVPGEYLRSAIQCDQTWNGTQPGAVGTFEAYLRSLPPVIGLGFGGYGEWSKELSLIHI